MQNTSTGEIHPLCIEELKSAIPSLQFGSAFDLMKESEDRLQKAKDEAIPNREHQGPVFTIGEVLEIRGGKFRVNGITRKRIYLDSIPS